MKKPLPPKKPTATQINRLIRKAEHDLIVDAVRGPQTKSELTAAELKAAKKMGGFV